MSETVKLRPKVCRAELECVILRGALAEIDASLLPDMRRSIPAIADAILPLFDVPVDVEAIGGAYCDGCLGDDCVSGRWIRSKRPAHPFSEEGGCYKTVLAVLQAAGFEVVEDDPTERG